MPLYRARDLALNADEFLPYDMPPCGKQLSYYEIPAQEGMMLIRWECQCGYGIDARLSTKSIFQPAMFFEHLRCQLLDTRDKAWTHYFDDHESLI